MNLSAQIQVQRDLSAIIDLAYTLASQAVHQANATVDGHNLPGGTAMIALAPVANLPTWERRFELAEAEWSARALEAGTARRLEDGSVVHLDQRGRPELGLDEDDSWEPPLQTLRFWTDRYRQILGADWDHIPTLHTEASFLRHKETADWIAMNEPHFDRYADDIHTARTRLENLLYAGDRAERGVPCLYDECKGKRLVRKVVPARGPKGEKTWRRTPWHCPRCKRTWDDDRYAAMVTAASESAKVEVIDGTTWCTVEYAAKTTTRSRETIRTWAKRLEVAAVCILAGRRTGYVSLDEVRDRDDTTEKRARR